MEEGRRQTDRYLQREMRVEVVKETGGYGISREEGEWKLVRRQADRFFQRERRVEVWKETGR